MRYIVGVRSLRLSNKASNHTPNSTSNNAVVQRPASAQAIGRMAVIAVLLAILCALIYQHFYGENGRQAVVNIEQKLAQQLEANDVQRQKNARLAADVQDLKTGFLAIEEHARMDLGLIKPDETFVRQTQAPIVHSAALPISDSTPTVETVDEPLAPPPPFVDNEAAPDAVSDAANMVAQ